MRVNQVPVDSHHKAGGEKDVDYTRKGSGADLPTGGRSRVVAADYIKNNQHLERVLSLSFTKQKEETGSGEGIAIRLLIIISGILLLGRTTVSAWVAVRHSKLQNAKGYGLSGRWRQGSNGAASGVLAECRVSLNEAVVIGRLPGIYADGMPEESGVGANSACGDVAGRGGV